MVARVYTCMYMYIYSIHTKGYVHESIICMIRRERGEEINTVRERDREGDEGREREREGDEGRGS